MSRNMLGQVIKLWYWKYDKSVMTSLCLYTQCFDLLSPNDNGTRKNDLAPTLGYI